MFQIGGSARGRRVLAIATAGAVVIAGLFFGVGTADAAVKKASIKKGCVNHLAQKPYPEKGINKGDRIFYVYVTDPKTKKKQLDPRKCGKERVNAAREKIAERPSLANEQLELRGKDGLSDDDYTAVPGPTMTAECAAYHNSDDRSMRPPSSCQDS